MDAPATRAEDLPLLYRSILDLVTELERTTDRVSADRLRRKATEAYSHSWDGVHQRRLLSLESQLRERLALLDQPPRRRFSFGRPWRSAARTGLRHGLTR